MADGRRIMVPTRDGRCYYGAFDESDSTKLPAFTEPPGPITEGYAFLANSGEIKPLYLPQDRVVSGAVHPQKPVIALGTSSGQVALFDLVTGESSGPPFEHAGEIAGVAFNHDGSKIAARSSLGEIRTWNTANPSTPTVDRCCHERGSRPRCKRFGIRSRR